MTTPQEYIQIGISSILGLVFLTGSFGGCMYLLSVKKKTLSPREFLDMLDDDDLFDELERRFPGTQGRAINSESSIIEHTKGFWE